MTVIKFPSKLPAPGGLELARAELCGLLQNMAGLALAHANELMKANNAAEFAAVVRTVATDSDEASAGWAQLSKQIRDSWGV